MDVTAHIAPLLGDAAQFEISKNAVGRQVAAITISRRAALVALLLLCAFPLTQNIALAGGDSLTDPSSMIRGDDPAGILDDDHEHHRREDATHGESSSDADADRRREERASHRDEKDRDEDRDGR